MKQIDNRQKELQQLKSQKGHLLSFRDKSKVHGEALRAQKVQKQSKLLAGAEAKFVEPAQHPKVGRNEPCPCGSGKKYKKCCLGKEEGNQTS